MADNSKKGNNGKHSSRVSSRRKRSKGGIGADGKPIAPVVITAAVVILLFVAIYFGTVEGWFTGRSDPASIDATIPPEITPQPSMSTSQPISVLDDKTLTVLVLDVGGGHCSLLMSPNGKTMLIDSGDAAHYGAVKSAIDSHGIKKLDVVFATAAEEGHIGAMEQLVCDYEIGCFYVCPAVISSGGFTGLLGALEENEVNTRQVWAGTSGSVQWDKSCTVDILAPIPERPDSAEYSDCIALRVSHGGRSVLFAGVLDSEAEEAALAFSSADKFKCSVLCVASGGAENTTGLSLLSAASPTWAVISACPGSQPADAVLARLNARGIGILRTDKNGTVTIVIDKEGIKVN